MRKEFMSRMGDAEKGGGRMYIVCSLCGRPLAVDEMPEDGQHVKCAHCGGKFSYSASETMKEITQKDLAIALYECRRNRDDNRYYSAAPSGARLFIGLLFYGKHFKERVNVRALIEAFNEIEPELKAKDIAYLKKFETNADMIAYFDCLLAIRSELGDVEAEARKTIEAKRMATIRLPALGIIHPKPAGNSMSSGSILDEEPIMMSMLTSTTPTTQLKRPVKSSAVKDFVKRVNRRIEMWRDVKTVFVGVCAMAVIAAVAWVAWIVVRDHSIPPSPRIPPQIPRPIPQIPRLPLPPLYECETNDSGVVITKYNGEEANVVVPAELSGHQVIGVGCGAFSFQRDMVRVTLPDCVRQIGDGAFRECGNLSEVKLPTQLRTIGRYAFSECVRLRSIAMPKSVTEIGYKAFNKCDALKRVDVFDIKAWCEIRFRSRTANPLCANGGELYLNGQRIVNLKIPDQTSIVREFAFSGLPALESVEFPASLTEICSYAFEGCRALRQIVFKGSEPKVGHRAFASVVNDCVAKIPIRIWHVTEETWRGMKVQYYSSSPSPQKPPKPPHLTTNTDNPPIVVPQEPVLTNVINGCILQYKEIDGEVSIVKGTIVQSPPAGSIVLPSQLGGKPVTVVGDGAFADCDKITKATIPEGVRRIGNQAFKGCRQLSQISFPASLIEIGNEAFYECDALHFVSLTKRVKQIGDRAFWSSSGGKKSVLLSQRIDSLSFGKNVFRACSVAVEGDRDAFLEWIDPISGIVVVNPLQSDKAVTVVPHKKAIPKDLKYRITNGGVVIEGVSPNRSGVLRIPSTINGARVVRIKDHAFYKCKLTKIIVPEFVTSIDEYAFRDCKSLTCAVFLANNVKIAKNAFYGCDDPKIIIGPEKQSEPEQQPVPGDSKNTTDKVGSPNGKPGSKYMVIDLSGGSSAGNFPVCWLDDVPASGWTDEYKTSKLVLRRISAGTFMMGSPENECGREGSEKQHRVTLTKPYYIGVFEVTRKQYSLVTGRFGISDSEAGMRPMSNVSWESVRGNRFDYDWPTVGGKVAKDSFMGILRTRTGITTFDLPTEARWEYACRAGTENALNNGKNLTSKYKSGDLDVLGRYSFNGGNEGEAPGDWGRKGEAIVGSYRPNAWGLYDMHGNVCEWCLDKFSYFDGKPVVDPVGIVSDNPDHGRVVKGGSYVEYACTCRSSSRYSLSPHVNYGNYGFRVCCDAIGAAHPSASSTLTALSLSVENPVKDTWPVRPSPNTWEPQGQMASAYRYKASISCIVPKDSRETVMVEVYFITDVAEGRGREKIEDMKIFSFEFGGEKPRTQRFEFSSPEVRGRRIEDVWSDGRRVNREGVRYKGCILRVVQDGKILKVITKPSNSKWAKAGEKPFVTLEDNPF